MKTQNNEYPAVLVVGLNPTVQKTLVLEDFELGGVNRSSEYLFTVGGKGANASRVMHQLGHNPVYLTQAGGQMRPFFLSQLEQDGVRTEWVESNSEIRFCYTLVRKEPHSATEIVENGAPVDEETDRRVREKFARLLPECCAMVIAGSKTQGFSRDIYLDMMKKARQAGETIVIDLAGRELQSALEYAPDVIKINLYEFITAFMPETDLGGQNVGEHFYTPAAERAAAIYHQTGSKFVLSNGSMDTLIIDGEQVSRISPKRVQALNPIGSGDAFTGGLTAGLVEGLRLHDAAAKGMDCAKRNLRLLKTGTIR